MAHQVFLCHSARDKVVADAACAALEAQGIPCWIAPRDVLAGEEWGKSIIDALTNCKVVVLIFSGHANESPQVRREIERAVSKGKIILPFRIEDVLPSDAMEYALGNTHWLDAITPSMEGHLGELGQTVLRLLEGPRKVPPPPWSPRTEAVAAVSGASGHVMAQQPVSAGSSGTGAIATGRKGWVWGGVGAILVAAIVIGFLVSRPTEVIVREPPASPPSATTVVAATTGAAPAGRVPQQDVSATGAAAERFYRDKDYAAAFPLSKEACDGGVAAGCNYEAAMYVMGAGVGRDYVRAVELYRRACDGGKPAGCSNVGSMYQTGRGVVQDDAQALTYYAKSCDEGYALGCTAVGDIYEKGRGVAADAARAATFYDKGCDEDSMSGCADLGALLWDGRGVQQDRGQAMRLYRKACDGKYQFACDFLTSHPQ